MELKSFQIAKDIFRKKNKTGGITLSNFKLYYEIIVNRAVWCSIKTHS